MLFLILIHHNLFNYYFIDLDIITIASALVILFCGLNTLPSYPFIIFSLVKYSTDSSAHTAISKSSLNLVFISFCTGLPFISFSTTSTSFPLCNLAIILAASCLVIGWFGLKLPSSYPFMYPHLAAILTSLKYQSVGLTSLNPQFKDLSSVFIPKVLFTILTNSALVIESPGLKVELASTIIKHSFYYLFFSPVVTKVTIFYIW